MEINLTFIIQISNILICISLLKKFLVLPILENINNKKSLSDKIAESNSNELQLLEKIQIKTALELESFKKQAIFLIENKEPSQLQISNQSYDDLKTETSNCLSLSLESKETLHKNAKLCAEKLMEVINDC